jgi:SOS-response transcriptional repressor LexA
MRGPTKKQERILRIIVDYADRHGYVPRIRELLPLTGYSSVSTVHAHVMALVRKGFLDAHICPACGHHQPTKRVTLKAKAYLADSKKGGPEDDLDLAPVVSGSPSKAQAGE